MDFIHSLQTNPVLLLSVVTLISLLVGSFLNVVIYRLPIMMNNSWRTECHEFLKMPATDVSENFTLLLPHSHCQQCGHTIRAWENIPIVSYLLLGGTCSQCQSPISIRYPLVEAATAMLSLVVAWHFGATLQMLGALVLTWTLIASSLIDCDHQFIPDNITLPMLWLGLLLNMYDTYVPLPQAVIGAVVGYSSLWLFTKAFYLATGKVGMGNGDFKLFAMFGAWFGWQVLPFTLIASSMVGAIVGLTLMAMSKAERDTQIPFGPYLAIAGWLAMMWGTQINQTYLQLVTA